MDLGVGSCGSRHCIFLFRRRRCSVRLVLRDPPSFARYFQPATRNPQLARFAPAISRSSQDAFPVPICVSADTIIAYISCVISTPERPSLSELQVSCLTWPSGRSTVCCRYVVGMLSVLYVSVPTYVCVCYCKTWLIGDLSIISLAIRYVQVPGRSASLALFFVCVQSCAQSSVTGRRIASQDLYDREPVFVRRTLVFSL
ncbi:hypothetical protein F4814DRAFT_375056 [Daldinia grandis]|nr:hypothetical protein F4814DRAFT_375056 [Daldinia grandis]